MKWLKFATRNVVRNKRRSLIAILITAIGVAGILVSGGFTLYTYDALREMAARSNGHIILAHHQYFSEQEDTPLQFGLENYSKYQKKLMAYNKIRAVLPKLSFSGLISNDNKSTVFVGQGIAPGEFKVKGPFLNIIQGTSLSTRQNKDSDVQIMIGKGLAKALKAKPGSSLTLLSTTVEGPLNAVDVTVQGVFSTGVPEVDKRLLLMPINKVQELLQTSKVSLLSVYLYKTSDTDQMARQLLRQYPQLSLHTWRDEAFYYESVRGLYNRIFGLLGIVILLMVLFAVTNSLSMSVIERTREIGTLRAIGTQYTEIVRNFILEALVMSVTGVLLGMLISASIAVFFYIADIQMPPPPARSQGYPLLIDVNLIQYLFTGLGIILLSILSAWFVVRKIANKTIVEELTHV